MITKIGQIRPCVAAINAPVFDESVSFTHTVCCLNEIGQQVVCRFKIFICDITLVHDLEIRLFSAVRILIFRHLCRRIVPQLQADKILLVEIEEKVFFYGVAVKGSE